MGPNQKKMHQLISLVRIFGAILMITEGASLINMEQTDTTNEEHNTYSLGAVIVAVTSLLDVLINVMSQQENCNQEDSNHSPQPR